MSIYRQNGSDARGKNSEQYEIKVVDFLDSIEFPKHPTNRKILSSLNLASVKSEGRRYSGNTQLVIESPDSNEDVTATCEPIFGLTEKSLVFSGDTSTVNVNDSFIIYPSSDHALENTRPAIFDVIFKDSNGKLYFEIIYSGQGFTNASNIDILYVNGNSFDSEIQQSPLNVTYIQNEFCICDIVITNEGSGYVYNELINVSTTNEGNGVGFIGSLISGIKCTTTEVEPNNIRSFLYRDLPIKENKFGELTTTISSCTSVNKTTENITYPTLSTINTSIQNQSSSYHFDETDRQWVQNFSAQQDGGSSTEPECDYDSTTTDIVWLGVFAGYLGISTQVVRMVNNSLRQHRRETKEQDELRKQKKIRKKAAERVYTRFRRLIKNTLGKTTDLAVIKLNTSEKHIALLEKAVKFYKTEFSKLLKAEGFTDNVDDIAVAQKLWKRAFGIGKKLQSGSSRISRYIIDIINNTLYNFSSTGKYVGPKYGSRLYVFYRDLFRILRNPDNIPSRIDRSTAGVVLDPIQKAVEEEVIAIDTTGNTGNTGKGKGGTKRASPGKLRKTNGGLCAATLARLNKILRHRIGVKPQPPKKPASKPPRRGRPRVPFIALFYACMDYFGNDKSLVAAGFDSVSPVTTDDVTELFEGMTGDLVFTTKENVSPNVFLSRSDVSELLKEIVYEVDREAVYVNKASADTLLTTRLYDFYDKPIFWSKYSIPEGTDPSAIYTDDNGEQFILIEIDDTEKNRLVQSTIDAINANKFNEWHLDNFSLRQETYIKMSDWTQMMYDLTELDETKTTESLNKFYELLSQEQPCDTCSAEDWDTWSDQLREAHKEHLQQINSSSPSDYFPPLGGEYLFELLPVKVKNPEQLNKFDDLFIE